MMIREKHITPCEREIILRQRYSFAHSSFEAGAWSAMRKLWGEPKQWERRHVSFAHHFLNILHDLTPETLSLCLVKERLSNNIQGPHLHKVMFYFFCAVKEEYQADDVCSYHDLIYYLETAGMTYQVLYDKDVHNFDDIAYLKWGKRRHFYVVRTTNSLIKSLVRMVMMETQWTFDRCPNQNRLDLLTDILEKVSNESNPVARIKDINIPFFFELMDEVNREYHQGMISASNRKLLIKDIIHIFRFCIKARTGIQPYGPITDLRIFSLKTTVKYFLTEYKRFDTTFYYFHWIGLNKYPTLITIDIQNVFLRKAYGEFLESGRECRMGFIMCHSTFEESLGDYVDNVGSPGYPFNEATLFRQVNYYSERYKGNHHASEAITYIKMFYLFLDEQTKGGFFREAKALNYKLLTSGRFETYCKEGYSFRRYHPYDKTIINDKVVFSISGLHRYRKGCRSEDCIAFDLSSISSSLYRTIAWKAITASTKKLYNKSHYYVLREILPFLARLKSLPGYPTPQLDYISSWDALFIAEYYDNKSVVTQTYNCCIKEIRAFFRWASITHALKVDNGVYMCLKCKKNPSVPTNTPVLSDDEILAYTEYFRRKARKVPVYSQVLIVFHLCLITPLRIGHICSLKLDELVYDELMKTYIVYSTSKATRGSRTEIVLGDRATDFIHKAMKIHKSIAQDCFQEDLVQYLFGYKSRKGMYTILSSRFLAKKMNEASIALGLPHFTTRNLRATYMTRVFVDLSEKGEVNDFVLRLLAYHKRHNTTLENYVNHSEALASLSDFLKRGNNWQKTLYPDKIAALKDVIRKYQLLIDASSDDKVKAKLQLSLSKYESDLVSLQG